MSTENTPRPVMRRIINQAAMSARPDRLSVIDKRHLNASVAAIEARENAALQIHVAQVAATRNDRADVVLDALQRQACDMVLQNQFAVIGGYAGSGKTTTVKYVLDDVAAQVSQIDWLNYRSVGKEYGTERAPAIGLLCFANVAARNLASKLPEKWAAHCMSIHAALAFAPVEVEVGYNGEVSQRFEPRYHSANKLPLDAIFIDEAGMVPRELWHMLLAAIQPHCRIYFLGDLAQLPAMTGASPMPFAVVKWPSVILDTIYRQKDGSALLENLTNIRRGIMPTHDAQTFRCGEKELLPSAPSQAKAHIAAYIATLYKMGVWDPAQDIIITGENEAALGQKTWNTAFRYAFNPEKRDENGVHLNPPILMRTALGVINLAVGDKVMATDSGGRTATERRFVNGSIGTIIRIEPNPDYKGDMTGLGAVECIDATAGEDRAQAMFEFVDNAMADAEAMADEVAGLSTQQETDEDTKRRQASHIVTVLEQATGEEYVLTRSAEIASLTHAYAATCHKFQGSQARNVLVICHRNMSSALTREWLYTACSRAQKRCFLLHEPAALEKAVSKQQIIGRNPREKAEHLLSIYANRQFAVPKLPEPRTL